MNKVKQRPGQSHAGRMASAGQRPDDGADPATAPRIDSRIGPEIAAGGVFRCRIPLSPGFRVNDVLALHRRDGRMFAERTTERSVDKGLLWDGCPAHLSIVFEADAASAALCVDAASGREQEAADTASRLLMLCRHMLGLDPPVELFEDQFGRHPQLGPLLARQSGLRVPQAASPFEALSWAVIGQQVSVNAAVSMRRNFIRAAGLRHSGGLWCYPDAAAVAVMDEASLREAGLSRSKAACLLELSRGIVARELPLEDWLTALQGGRSPRAPDVEEMRRRLLAVRGIGPWTVNYALLRGFGWLDGSLHGDAAVRRNLGRLLGQAEPVTGKQAEQWIAPFTPWRALAAAHLWAMQSAAGY